jgi:hypothetical protein
MFFISLGLNHYCILKVCAAMHRQRFGLTGYFLYLVHMITVNILEIEETPMGEMADVVLEKSFEPAPGMMLMDEDSQTWEVTAMLHDAKRITQEESTKRWTFQCKPVNTQSALHTGVYKIIH